MTTPTVSVIIPAYNRAHLVVETLESVFAQTYTDYEVIVVDDGSTDDTRDVLKPYLNRIRYVWQENQGISGARNKGILLSKGRYIAFLDSDDRWLPEKLAKQIAYLETHPKVGLISSYLWRYEIGKEEKKERQPRGFPRNFEDLLMGPHFVPTSSTLVRRKCFEMVGIFDPTLPLGEDWDLWLRIARRFDIHCLDEVLAEHRRHPTNTTRDMAIVYEGYWRFYVKALKLYRDIISDVELFKNRAASFRYLLGTTYLKRGEMQKALIHIAGSLKMRWFIGTYFDKQNSLFTTIKYFLKPYGALTISFLGTVVSPLMLWGRSR